MTLVRLIMMPSWPLANTIMELRGDLEKRYLVNTMQLDWTLMEGMQSWALTNYIYIRNWLHT